MAEIRDRALFEAFDFDSLPPDEYPLWRERWKSKCYAENEWQFSWSRDQLVMLVRLKDEDTINFLLSQLEQGQGRSQGAAEILGESGQEWLIPRLEKTLFLKPENEPKDDNPGDVVFGTISEYSRSSFMTIIEKSRVLTPRLKSWFNLVGGTLRHSEYSSETDALIRKWWDLNRERIVAGEYRKLAIPSLWPDDKAGEDGMDVPFGFADYMAATRSNYVSIQLAAMQVIQDRKMGGNWMEQREAAEIGEYLKSKNSDLRSAAYRLLESAGERGVEVFSAVFSKNPELLPSSNVVKLLNAHPTSAAERARYIASIVANDGTSYMANHKSRKVEAFPLLKQRVLDSSLSKDDRTSAFSYLGIFGSSADIPFFEEMLKSSQPVYIRESAVYNIFQVSSHGDLPASLLALENDPDLGVTIRKCLDQRAAPAIQDADEPLSVGTVQDGELTGKFSELFKYDVNIGQRDYVAYSLARSGEQGIALLKLALTMSDDAARGCAAHALLEKGVGSPEEQDKFLAALIIGLGDDDSEVSDFLNTKEDLHAKALPLLKQRVLDEHVQRPVRAFAALLAAAFASKEDVPFFESLLATNFPGPVRSAALHAIYRLLTPAEVPGGVKALINDKDLGEVMRIYRYADQ